MAEILGHISGFIADVADKPVFYLISLVIIFSALMVVTLKNIFHCALVLILTLFMVAGIYILLPAEFLAAVQVLIYVGAVSVLIIFAIMLAFVYNAICTAAEEEFENISNGSDVTPETEPQPTADAGREGGA